MEVQALLAVPVSIRLGLRWSAASFALLSLLILAGCGGDGDAPTAPGSTVPRHSQSMPPPQKPEKADGATSDGARGSNHHAKRTTGHDHDHGRGETAISKPDRAKHVSRSGPDSAPKPAGCPASLSAQQCDELAQEAADEEHAPRQPPKPSCPRSIDRSTCEEAAQKAEAQPKSTPPGRTEAPLQCPEALSRSQCEELEAQLGQS
jgi:hypothetical protein